MSFYNYPQVVPHLVEDVNLKRARVETEEGDAIRVTGINCGDKVTIVPTLSEGTKIADFTINNVDGELYAPEAPTPPVTEVSITPSVTTGTKIADFSINEVAGELYAPQGGVGEAYPGSTGGEIFNYYGTDSNKNVASGNYSTARGRKVTAEKENTFSSGYNIKNDVTNGIAIGRNISLRGFNDGVHACGIAIGRNISVSGGSSASTNDGVIAIGDRIFGTSDSDVLPSVGEGPTRGIYIGSSFERNTANNYYAVGAMIGKGLKLKSAYGDTDNTNGNAFIVGQYNDTNLPDALFAIGCGTDRNNRKNALSVSNTNFKILNDLQLATDSTVVNAITAPQDPDNVTQDDKTLITKSHLANNLGNYTKSQVAYKEDWDTASALPLDNTTVSLPTTYGAIPSWASRAILTFRWENELITKEIFFDKDEGIHLYVVQRAYSTFPDTIHYRHLRIEWDFTNQTLVVKDYWTYDQDMANAGALSNWDYTLTNASPCKILSVIYSE